MRRMLSMFLLFLLFLFPNAVPAADSVPLPAPVPPVPEDLSLPKPAPPVPEETVPEEPSAPADEGFDIVLTFSGDMLLASLKNQTAKGNFNDYAARNDPSYFLENVRPIFEGDDLTLVNLENVLTDRALPEREKNQDPAYWFRSRTANIQILTGSGVEAVSLANNHTNDYGPKGFQDTAKAVEDAGLLYGNNNRVFYFEKNGYRVAFICHGLWLEEQAGDIIARLREAEQDSDFQIVFYHGGAEGVHAPEAWKQRACRKLVDSGAGLVVGSHPHVLQPREVYNGAEIVYSMGNFCYGGSNYPENRTILYQYTLHIGPDGTLERQSGEIIPCYVHTGTGKNNYRPAVIEDEAERQKVLDFMDGKIKSPL